MAHGSHDAQYHRQAQSRACPAGYSSVPQSIPFKYMERQNIRYTTQNCQDYTTLTSQDTGEQCK